MNKAVVIATVMFPLMALSLSGLAESVERAGHNAYFRCKHSQRKVERTKICPCGCNKKARAARITSAHDDCAGDDVVAHLPHFAKISARSVEIISIAPVLLARRFEAGATFFRSISIEPVKPPG